MYELEVSNANNLVTDLKSRGLEYNIKVIGDNNSKRNPEDGVYIIFGTNGKAIENMSSNEQTFLDEYDYQETERANIFPSYTIVKLENNSMAAASDFCNKRDAVQLVDVLFKRYKLPIPGEITQGDFKSVYRSYKQSIDESATEIERDSANESLKYLLSILSSGLTQDEYDKKNGGFNFVGNKKLAKKINKKAEEIANKIVKYEPQGKNCVDEELLKRSNGTYKTVNIDHDILPYFEKDMAKHPKIKYSIVKESKVSIHGENGYKYWHMLTFPAQHEKTIAAVMHKYERDLIRVSKKYPDGMQNIFTAEILATDFDNFYDFARKHNLQFYFDEKGTYAKSTINTIGIVVEDAINKDLLIATLTCFIEQKIKGSYLTEEIEFNKKHKTPEITSRNDYYR